jgi:hypothetical protein
MGRAEAASSAFRVFVNHGHGPEPSRGHRAEDPAPEADDPVEVSPASHIKDRSSAAADSESTYADRLGCVRQEQLQREESQVSRAGRRGARKIAMLSLGSGASRSNTRGFEPE